MKINTLVLTFVFSGCSTLLESVTPFQNQPAYQIAKNSGGETVHRQTFTNPQPVIRPIYIPEPRLKGICI